MNVVNLFPNAVFSVTNIILTLSGGFLFFYFWQLIFNSLHYFFMFCFNAINNIIIIVISFFFPQNTGNMNIKFLFFSVSMMLKTLFFPCMIISMFSCCCWPLNSNFGFIIFFNSTSKFIFFNFFYCFLFVSLFFILYMFCFYLLSCLTILFSFFFFDFKLQKLMPILARLLILFLD